MKYKQVNFKRAVLTATVAALATAAAVGYKGHNSGSKTEIKGDYIAVSPKDFANIYDSSVLVHRSLTLEEKCSDSFSINHVGSGVLLQDSQTEAKYVLTAEHVTVNQSFSCKEDPSKERSIKIKNGKLTVAGYAATELKENESADLALLKIEGGLGLMPAYKGKIAKQFNIGDYVMGVGYPGGKHVYFIANVKDIEKNWIILNHASKGGNSGGGIFRFGEQGFELMGAMRGGTAISSLKNLRELFKDTPLEDDYL